MYLQYPTGNIKPAHLLRKLSVPSGCAQNPFHPSLFPSVCKIDFLEHQPKNDNTLNKCEMVQKKSFFARPASSTANYQSKTSIYS